MIDLERSEDCDCPVLLTLCSLDSEPPIHCSLPLLSRRRIGEVRHISISELDMLLYSVRLR